ncbi:MAG: hypothetical protein IT207_05855 [Fimbriimonadaceae bacterium]|nr:hypothetical protein [Fimbriimonadaceae bacterium]
MPFKFRQQSWSGSVTAWFIVAVLTVSVFPWVFASPWRKGTWVWILAGSIGALGFVNLLSFGEMEPGAAAVVFVLAIIALVSFGLGVSWSAIEFSARLLRLTGGGTE